MFRADLANLVNEAALLAGRQRKVVVEKNDFIQAVERSIAVSLFIDVYVCLLERERRFLFYCAYFSIMFICFLFLKMNCYVDCGLLTYDWNIIQQLIMISLFLSHLSSKFGLCDLFIYF